MSAALVFMMGEHSAEFPVDRMYAKNHMWAQTQSDGAVRFGLSAYAVRLLQDVYFLDLIIEPQMALAAKQEIGSIESKKAESSLYAPLPGLVTELNEELLQDPTGINLDKYGAGWMFEMAIEWADADSAESPEPTGAAKHSGAPLLLNPQQYIQHLTSAWEVAQRTIKGQVNA